VLLTDSGTSALALALRATTADGSEAPRVALPAYCCPDVGTAAIAARSRILLYDVAPDTLRPEPASLAAALTAGATHVVVAHLFGRVMELSDVVRMVEAHGAVLIEDAAQHAGGSVRGVRAGALAPWSVLSFGRGKGINAGGGGALLWATAEEQPLPAPPPSSRLRSCKLLAGAWAGALLSDPRLYWMPASVPALGLGETRFREPQPVRGMPLAAAALLVAALDAEPSALAARQAVEQWYWEQLEGVSHLLLARPDPGTRSGALRFPVRIPVASAATLARHGVARSYPRTLADYPEIAAHLVASPGPLPGARALAATLHTLPTHDLLVPTNREQLVRALCRLR
jgi:dTDP-4-amino-4,6-dideoxygalactose transaminase